jgi:integrase/recombinase XerD
MSNRPTVYDVYETEDKKITFNPINNMLLKEFLEHCVSQKMSPETIKQYKNRIEVFYVWLLEERDNKSFLDVKKKDIIAWQSSRVLAGKSSCNIRQTRSALSSLANYICDICDEEYPNFQNIINKVKAPSLEYTREKTYLSQEEINIIKNELIFRKELQKLVYLLLTYDSASRKSEAWQALKNVNFETRETNIVKGKGKKTFTMPFSKETAIYIKQYLDKRGEDDCPYLFVSTSHKKKVTHIAKGTLNNWCKYFSAILKEKTGREANIYPHSFKTNRLSNLYHDSHLPIEVIQQFGHHSDPAVTLNSYIEHRQTDVNKSVFDKDDET